MDFVIGGLVGLGVLFLLFALAAAFSEEPCCPRCGSTCCHRCCTRRDTYAENLARHALRQTGALESRVEALERKSLTRYGSRR